MNYGINYDDNDDYAAAAADGSSASMNCFWGFLVSFSSFQHLCNSYFHNDQQKAFDGHFEQLLIKYFQKSSELTVPF